VLRIEVVVEPVVVVVAVVAAVVVVAVVALVSGAVAADASGDAFADEPVVLLGVFAVGAVSADPVDPVPPCCDVDGVCAAATLGAATRARVVKNRARNDMGLRRDGYPRAREAVSRAVFGRQRARTALREVAASLRARWNRIVNSAKSGS
jgi:hypothetical protein